MGNYVEISFEVKPQGWVISKAPSVGQGTATIDIDDVVEFLCEESTDVYAEDLITGCAEYLLDINADLPFHLVSEVSDRDIDKVRHAVYTQMRSLPNIRIPNEELLKAYFVTINFLGSE